MKEDTQASKKPSKRITELACKSMQAATAKSGWEDQPEAIRIAILAQHMAQGIIDYLDEQEEKP